AAEWIVFVAANRETPFTLDGDLDATDRFANTARTIVRGTILHACIKPQKSTKDHVIFLCFLAPLCGPTLFQSVLDTGFQILIALGGNAAAVDEDCGRAVDSQLHSVLHIALH